MILGRVLKARKGERPVMSERSGIFRSAKGLLLLVVPGLGPQSESVPRGRCAAVQRQSDKIPFMIVIWAFREIP